MIRPRVFFRVDGSSTMGLGHMIRSSSLAALLAETYQCTLITRCDLPDVVQQVASSYTAVEQIDNLTAEQELNFYSTLPRNSTVVLDGYHFDTTYQAVLKNYDLTVVCIDDIHDGEMLASAVINHGGGVSPLAYHTLPWCLFFMGPLYVLLRAPFREANKSRRLEIDNSNVLVCLGGADPANDTLRIVKELAALQRFATINVVVGGGYLHHAALEAFVGANQQHNIVLHKALLAAQMVAVMRACSFAVCPPSSVAYEYLSVGGVLFLHTIAGNQKELYTYLTTQGLAFPYSAIAGFDTAQVPAALQQQAVVFDGKADTRLQKIFKLLEFRKQSAIRRATPADVKMVYTWATDPVVRASSYRQEPIAYNDHVTWFEGMLINIAVYYYIVEHRGEAVAQIHFKLSDNTATLSYLIAESHRGKGLAAVVLSLGIKKFLADYGRPVTISGFVKFSNVASQASFEKLRFEKRVATTYADSYNYTMHYEGHTPRR